MSTTVQICNMAILRVGGKSISSLTENSREAEICNVFYASCRDQVLSGFPWNFSKKQEALALLAAAPPTNWAYAYALPVGCLKVISVVVPGARVVRSREAIPFSVGTYAGVRALLTDMPDAELEYIAAVEESFFTPAFESCLAWRLASELAGPLFGKPDLASAAKQTYYQELSIARRQDLQEQSDYEPESELITVRGVSSDFLADGRIIR